MQTWGVEKCVALLLYKDTLQNGSIQRIEHKVDRLFWSVLTVGGRGWTWGYMPRVWIADIGGVIYVYMGTLPSWAAPQCTHFGREDLGIETWWNGDRQRWTHPIHYGL